MAESPRYRAVATGMEQSHAEGDCSHMSKRLHHQSSLSNMEINLEEINKSLASINTFATRRQEQLQPLIIYEITSFGESNYKSMTLRELLLYVNRGVDDIDDGIPLESQVEETVRDRQSKDPEIPRVYEVELEKVRTPTRRRAVSRRIDRDKGTIVSYSPSPKAPDTTLQTPSQSRAQSLSRESPQPRASISLPSSEEAILPMAVKSLRVRDLRRLDTNTSTLNDTAIVVKRHAVIFAMVRSFFSI